MNTPIGINVRPWFSIMRIAYIQQEAIKNFIFQNNYKRKAEQVLYVFKLRDAAKKVLFLMASPPPLGLMAIGFNILFLSLNSRKRI